MGLDISYKDRKVNGPDAYTVSAKLFDVLRDNTTKLGTVKNNFGGLYEGSWGYKKKNPS